MQRKLDFGNVSDRLPSGFRSRSRIFKSGKSNPSKGSLIFLSCMIQSALYDHLLMSWCVKLLHWFCKLSLLYFYDLYHVGLS